MRIDHLTIDDWVNVKPHRVQRFVRAVTRRPGKWLFRYRAYGSERIPMDGGFILAPTHGSFFDGFIFGHGFQRTVRFMGKHQVFESRWIGRIARMAGGFPVRRGEHGQPALEIARRVLATGHGLIIFMEGHLVRHPGLGQPRNGAAILALQTGVPVVPVAGCGNKPAWVYGRKRRPWRRPRVTVVWGEPMQFEQVADPSPELIERTRDEIWAEVTRLHKLATRIHNDPAGRPATLALEPR